MLSRIAAIAINEVRQLRRDRLTFGMIVGIPLLQMLMFGYAINFDVRGLHAGVVDEAQTSASRDLVNSTDTSRDERRAARQRFAQDVGDAFRTARQDREVGGAIPVGQRALVDRAEEVNGRSKIQPLGERFEAAA